MKLKIAFGLIACSFLLCGVATAETRTYRQVKDVVVKENGTVSQSGDRDNLFEYTFNVDPKNNTITRTKTQRLDQAAAKEDTTVYNITQKRELLPSESGNGGKVLVAIRKDGSEILELSHRFAYTLRLSPFSQVITGIYKRDYDQEGHEHFQHHGDRRH